MCSVVKNESKCPKFCKVLASQALGNVRKMSSELWTRSEVLSCD